MSLIAVLLAALVGVTLGLFGGGGAVLAVPIFVYVLGVPVKSAVPMSFVVIGLASAIGAAQRWHGGYFDARRGLVLGIAAVAGAFTGATIGVLISSRIQLSLFGAAMILAAISMIRSASQRDEPHPVRSVGILAATFAMIGVFTGIVGVGGGFLFVPALVTLVGVPMGQAAGLSLMVIAMNAAAALVGYVSHVAIDWKLSFLFAAVVVAAMLPAGAMAKRVPVPVLKRAFAGLLVAVGVFVLFDNIR